MTWQPTPPPPPPPPPPPASTSRFRFWALALAALVVLGVGFSLGSSDEPRAREATSNSGVALTESTGESSLNYMAEVMIAVEQVDNAMFHGVNAADFYIDGNISGERLVEVLREQREVVLTQSDRVKGMNPPPDFEESHELLLESWATIEESFYWMALGVETGNPVLMDEGVALMSRVSDQIDQATAALPDS